VGGYGSGRWMRHRTKLAAELCLRLEVGDFPFRSSSAGAIRWEDDRGQAVVLLRYHLARAEANPTLHLCYRRPLESSHLLAIRLESTPTHFGRPRWWFTCPLVKDGRPCNRRVGVLYLPPGAEYFGCRRCYELTYRSVQEAHKQERRIAGIVHQLTQPSKHRSMS